MIEFLLLLFSKEQLGPVPNRTKWNGDRYNNPYEIKTTTGFESNVFKHVSAPHIDGRVPRNIWYD